MNTSSSISVSRTFLKSLSDLLGKVSEYGLVYGLAVVIGWIGAMKFTAYEAAGIEPLVRHSPFLGFFYQIVSVRSFSSGLGCVEILIALLMALFPISKGASLIGGALGIGMFLTTLTFLVSTPGVWLQDPGFPAISSDGQFLIKDLVLLFGSVFVTAKSLQSLASDTPASTCC